MDAEDFFGMALQIDAGAKKIVETVCDVKYEIFVLCVYNEKTLSRVRTSYYEKEYCGF